MIGHPEPWPPHRDPLAACPRCGQPLTWTAENRQRCIPCRFAWMVGGPYTAEENISDDILTDIATALRAAQLARQQAFEELPT